MKVKYWPVFVALTSLILVGFLVPASEAADSLYSLTDLGTLGGDNSRASGINNNGEVVAYAEYGDYNFDHAFLYSDGTIIDLDASVSIDYGYFFANAINDIG